MLPLVLKKIGLRGDSFSIILAGTFEEFKQEFNKQDEGSDGSLEGDDDDDEGDADDDDDDDGSGSNASQSSRKSKKPIQITKATTIEEKQVVSNSRIQKLDPAAKMLGAAASENEARYAVAGSGLFFENRANH